MLDTAERANRRVADLRDRGGEQLDSLFIERQPLDQALCLLRGRDDPLALVQQFAILHRMARTADAEVLRGQLSGLPRGLATVVELFATEHPVPGQEDPGLAALCNWQIRVQDWREVLGV